MKDLEFQEQKIKKLLYEMSSIFYDIQMIGEVRSSNPEDVDILYDIENKKDRFKYTGENIFKLCLAYLENKKMPEYLKRFVAELEPFLTDRTKTFSGSYHEESDGVYSDYTAKIWSYMSVFQFLGDDDYEALLKRTGITYLENILESTGVIIKELGVTPDSETKVYKAVKILSQASFPNAAFPSESFQKAAKCYIPDILIPSLNCAVEYKYAATESRLIETIDQILIDVKGYDKHPTYKIFYAVFYVKPGIWTKSRFDEVWKEKEFPENWKGILVIGN